MVTVLVDRVDTPLAASLSSAVRHAEGVAGVVAAAPGDVGGVARWDRRCLGPVDLIVMAPGSGPDRDGSGLGGVDLDGTGRLLDELTAAVGRGDLSLQAVVVVSSAMVYGARPSNPLPLTEQDPVAPSPGCGYAADKAHLEQLVLAWAAGLPGVRPPVAVLRPTLTVSADRSSVDWLERSLFHVPTLSLGGAEPPAQFLLMDDLVAAIDLARSRRLDGAYNVAPPGWLSAARQIELVGRRWRRRVPAFLAHRLAATRWRLDATSTPPEVVPYAMYRWVVSSDRLAAEGWTSTVTNDEAYVIASRSGWWASLSGRRRQEVSLVVLAGSLVGVGTLTTVLMRRTRRRRGVG